MTRYEVTTILAEETTPNPATGLVEQNGGKILNVEELGKRRFAYPINKLTGGAYHRVRFEAEASAIAKIDQALKHDTSIIRYLIVNQPHDPVAHVVAEVDDAAIEALGDVKEMTKKAEEEKIEAAKVATEPEAAVEETVEKIPAAEPVAEEVEEAPATEEVVAKDTKNSAGSEETEEVVDAEAREGALNKKLDEILGK